MSAAKWPNKTSPLSLACLVQIIDHCSKTVFPYNPGMTVFHFGPICCYRQCHANWRQGLLVSWLLFWSMCLVVSDSFLITQVFVLQCILRYMQKMFHCSPYPSTCYFILCPSDIQLCLFGVNIQMDFIGHHILRFIILYDLINDQSPCTLLSVSFLLFTGWSYSWTGISPGEDIYKLQNQHTQDYGISRLLGLHAEICLIC